MFVYIELKSEFCENTELECSFLVNVYGGTLTLITGIFLLPIFTFCILLVWIFVDVVEVDVMGILLSCYFLLS